MIKGVNKKIIEINNPDSLYFEKAILYLRPDVSILPEAISKKEAHRLVTSLMEDEYIETGKRSIFRGFFLIIGLMTAVILLMLLC